MCWVVRFEVEKGQGWPEQVGGLEGVAGCGFSDYEILILPEQSFERERQSLMMRNDQYGANVRWRCDLQGGHMRSFLQVKSTKLREKVRLPCTIFHESLDSPFDCVINSRR